MKKLICFILIGISAFSCFGIETEQDTPEQKRRSILCLPIFYYTPETKIAGGALVNYISHKSGSESISRPSTFMPSVVYTQKKQIMTELITDFYWKNEMYNLKSYTSYAKFPDTFYGVGNNTSGDDEENYTSRNAKLRLTFQKKVYSGWHVGVQYEFKYSKLIEIEENGLLASGNILGSEQGTASGAGVLINRDTRNKMFYPSSGLFYQVSAKAFGSALGSDYDFKKYNIDLRQYVSLPPAHILALQAYMEIITGEPPFQMLSLFGGRERMRGYYEGRYRDKNMVTFQMEYRIMPVWWRFGLVGFAGFGDVSDKMENFELRNFKYVVGTGIRFLFSRDEKLNLRLDFGYGKNASGMYITIGEAF